MAKFQIHGGGGGVRVAKTENTQSGKKWLNFNLGVGGGGVGLGGLPKLKIIKVPRNG